MKLHREGKNIIIISFFIVAALLAIILYIGPKTLWYQIPFILAAIIFYALIVRFFRVPNREFVIEDGAVISPADGKIVIIEEVDEPEFIKEKCIQISVFMSPLNVHINWFPFDGVIKYFKYHPGKYLVAWHPKSSTLNERTSVCVENKKGDLIMIRQIAGAVARRIVCYAKEGKTIKQNDEIGFIKFGSRVDVYLPLSAKPQVNIDDKVVGGRTILARF
jgi:phosphatidylserine decarboxylase